jgi:murein DD-endopeptidase MepM/ murein hydrolase activator NlpD
MTENSGMLAYMGFCRWRGDSPYRSHEGIDFDLHDARGRERHPLVAIENGTITLAQRHRGDGSQGTVVLRSASQPDIYYTYEHLHAPSIAVTEGQQVLRGDHVGYIWGDWSWGHLHFVVSRYPSPPDPRQLFTNVLNCFPQLYELYHGGLAWHPAIHDEGEFAFSQTYSQCGNVLRLSAYDDITGFGWRLGQWCPARVVEPGAIVRRTLHRGTPAEAHAPHAWHEFAVRVEPGTYRVWAVVGNEDMPTWQRVEFCGIAAGTFDLRDGGTLKTPVRCVPAEDGFLIIRLHTREEDPAGLRLLRFARCSEPAEQGA